MPQNSIYVADRGNRRIQVFNTDGKFLRQFTIDVPAPADARPAIGNKPASTTAHHVISRCALDPLHHAWPESSPLYFRRFSRPHLQTFFLTEKVLGILGNPASNSASSVGIHEIACRLRTSSYVAETLELAHPKANPGTSSLEPPQ